MDLEWKISQHSGNIGHPGACLPTVSFADSAITPHLLSQGRGTAGLGY